MILYLCLVPLDTDPQKNFFMHVRNWANVSLKLGPPPTSSWYSDFSLSHTDFHQGDFVLLPEVAVWGHTGVPVFWVMDCAQEVEESVCPGKQHLEHLPKAVPAWVSVIKLCWWLRLKSALRLGEGRAHGMESGNSPPRTSSAGYRANQLSAQGLLSSPIKWWWAASPSIPDTEFQSHYCFS
jgi:hypothetical protein